MAISNDRPTRVQDRPRPAPQGWGSHDERRLMLWFVAGFALLALYAAAFVIVGEVLWS